MSIQNELEEGQHLGETVSLKQGFKGRGTKEAYRRENKVSEETK